MVDRAEHEQFLIDSSLANLRRIGFFDELRDELKDIESFDLQYHDGEAQTLLELRKRRAKLELVDELDSLAESAEQRLAEGNTQ
jgi:hypothetical protein